VRNPGGLFAFDAALVKLVAGALENVKAMAELLQIPGEFVVDRKRIGREKEILFGEEALFREGRADRGEFVGIGHGRKNVEALKRLQRYNGEALSRFDVLTL
jgi:hypothetical protein